MYNLNDKIHRYWTEGMEDTRVEYRFDYSVCEKCGLKDKLQKESALLKETRDCLIESQKMHKRCADNAVKMIRHANYKRCLAMVRYCDMGLTCYNEKLDSFSCKRSEFFYRWYNRWWKIAEQFKEA